MNTKNKKQLIKKVVVTDEHSLPKARGVRLKKIRNLANLSRIALCTNDELNVNTYKSWELGRFGGLPLDGAQRVIELLSKEGVICTLDWLLYGKGHEPYLVSQLNNVEQILDDGVLKELAFFQSVYPNAIFSIVGSDTLSLGYECGDYVAGIKFYGNDMLKAVERQCIVGINDGRIIIGLFTLDGDEKELVYLMGAHDASIDGATVRLDELVFVAPITRLYKKNV